MTLDEDLLDLLFRWEEERLAGHSVTPDELCRDCRHLLPELQRHVEAVRSTEWMEGAAGDVGEARVGGPDAPATDEPPPPATLGRYRLEALLGQGGYGQVWRAYDPALQRKVAIKVPRRGRLATPARAEQFLAEARRMAGLRHPGIVPVYDVGEEGGWCFMVSALVEGVTLAEYRAGGVPPTSLAAQVAEVAEHLHYAHEQGFIHRDLKPANILVDHAGRPHLTDFGIAVSRAELRDGGVEEAGTLAYMAPEQLRGGGQVADVATDVYGLGVVLYEVLTGRQPFEADTPGALRARILQGRPTPPRLLNPAIPAPLEQVCMRALATDPRLRYPTADDFARALRAGLTCRPAKPGWGILHVLLALLAVSPVGAYLAWAVGSSNSPPDAASRSTGKDAAGPASPGSEQVPTLIEVRHFTGHQGGVVGLAFAPNGRRALSACTDDRTSRLWDLEEEKAVRTYQHRQASPLHTVLFTQDGHHFLHGDFGRVVLCSLEDGMEVRSFGPVDGSDRLYLALSPDEGFLAAGDDTTVTLWEFATGRQIWQDVENYRGQARALAFSPDGRRLVVGNRFGPALLYGVSAGRPLQQCATRSAVRAALFLPDGHYLILAGDEGCCHVWDTRPRPIRQIRSLAQQPRRVWSMAISQNGGRLVTGGEDGTIRLWDVATGQQLARGDTGGSAVFAVALSPDDRQALSGSADGVVRLWALPR